MKKVACQYAIVKFMPFIETAEFANVGIIMMAPKAGYFDFKLQTKRTKRYTQFFDELDAKVFRAAINNLKEELGRVLNVIKAHSFDGREHQDDFTNGLFAEVIRPRETIIRFSEPRLVLAENPKETLNQLYAFYVERNFVTKQYRESVLETGVRNLLLKAQVGGRFQSERVGDDEFTVPFPFVELDNNKPKKIIKPLNLGQDDSTRILEHGGKWEFRIRELKKRHVFPDKVLFPVEGPKSNDKKRQHAYLETIEMLTETGVNVLPFDRQNEIVDFALNG